MLLFTGIMLSFSYCKTHHDPAPKPVITDFSPISGIEGTTVTITGSHFDTNTVQVMFNETPATIQDATSSSITTTVPAGAITGKIHVVVKGMEATSENDFTVLTPPAITSFTPEAAAIGTAVTITGSGFSPVLSDNVVKFNGTAASVTAATATQLSVNVPQGATTGKISVTVSGLTGTASNDFTLLPTPSITDVSPAFGPVGATIKITGTNFSATPSANTVKFNGTTATVSAASTTQLTVTVPNASTSGKITVAVNGVTGTSSADFLVGCPDVIITSMSISNISGNSFTVTYNIKNIGQVPMKMTTMYIQSYVSANATYDAGDQPSGGFGDYGASEPLLQPDEVRQKTQSVTSPDISTYPYVIFELRNSAAGPSPECSTTNNTASKLIQ